VLNKTGWDYIDLQKGRLCLSQCVHCYCWQLPGCGRSVSYRVLVGGRKLF